MYKYHEKVLGTGFQLGSACDLTTQTTGKELKKSKSGKEVTLNFFFLN